MAVPEDDKCCIQSNSARFKLFDTKLADLRRWQETPWGKLRYTIAAANLARHLPDDACFQVLDVGGGNGRDAIELARLGHQVTVVDPSELSLAEARALAADHGVGAAITTLATDLDAITPDGIGTFDLILCHNVIQYLPDPPAAVLVLAAHLAPDGLLSLIAPNADADPLLAAVRSMDPDEALRLLDTATRRTATYDTEVRACYPDHLVDELRSAGLTVTARYGIRSACDLIADDARKSDPDFYASLERLELALSARPQYAATARFTHLIATRASSHRSPALPARPSGSQ
ncbi:class I SAM-dependent methyltransferase [Nocardia cyriacigeorgica]|uniref:class I SAM-dependent methyltransferase n=1 Tax=Nocardia cyriacigeorgica TaxID=135487 RepID=UPI0018945691|nr:class I SAM-dependent methyltransferase [Nocardia cyriacigeorgica]MBF6439562.1 methyltransferase domain-containing protein [Nocardia cyriacigeorgica]